MSAFTRVLEDNTEYQKIISAIRQKSLPMGVIGLSQIHKAHYISSAVSSLGKKALVICPDESSASKLVSDLNSFLGEAYLYPARDFRFRDSESKSLDFEQKRLGVLRNILDGKINFVVCSVEA